MTAAAALVLLAILAGSAEAQAAWYALVPPVAGGRVEALAPLGTWGQLRAFDTAEQCEKMVMGYAKELAAQPGDISRAVQYARCVHVADPRLK